MVARFNPFRPNNMAGPGMFVGRVDELKIIDQCLFQAKNGNPQHFLVQGERGIGKSSLLFYVEYLARGELTAFTENTYKFLVVSIDLGGCTTQFEIIRKLGRGLRQALADHNEAKEKAKEFFNWLLNWEVLGVKFHKQDVDLDAEQVADDLVSQFTNFCKQTHGLLDGILILIDEADRPGEEAGLGAFLKALAERLTRRNCNNVLFGLAGLPTLLGKLRNSHESSPRLFETMLLEPLEVAEREEVIRACLKQAKEKNGFETKITQDGMNFLVELSEGYPHFVHQFGYSAFEQDTDNEIDEDDVGEGAFKDGGALTQLGDKFFNEMYHARISSEDYRRVLDAMAEHGDRWVARKTIIAESGVSETNVNNALLTLKAKEIILQDETRRGFYRLPTNSFAAWINAIRAARAKSDALHGEGFAG
ncbi:MAG: AAA family ATPase [Phenylobacterium sp.]|uniref:AAA family ATPase n=1 Tax=Phenylobacterium sp. TaxID=1871053 RepID=UPI00391C3D6C